jgi:hypothetical protein
MFGLTLIDHLRLTFGHIIYTHRAHSRLALHHGRWNRGLQVAEALLMIGTAAAAISLVQTGQPTQAIVTAIAATLALVVLVVRLLFDFETSAAIHRACGAQLWHLREQYRALLADLQDGSITLEVARERRDALMQRLHDVYENAPPFDRTAYEAARSAAPAEHERALSDEEVDRFLPASMKKGDSGQSAA